ncbi:Rieske (2Fe-2S) domain-containing protein [Caulobacter sp. AP07]|uniref:Rieske 2Fe-2S domain-containing protein n=1 Tax=Caulobacter sp. AP07 TaxID=1144304 RepID=UPI000271E8D0|nr:Rieske 2Fe-2S domain-containing protein [Caulobacter sp. AP07]EJL30779.1 Rieske (2Fe-2S) domain-containing protein [Caulobacter sp. AP07]
MFLPIDAAPPTVRPTSSEIRPGDWAVLARFWHPVAKAEDLAEAPLAVKLLDVDLVLYRAQDGVTAALDMCPHRWIRLSAGTVTDGNIVCPFHGLAFDGTGQCVHVPALGRTAKLPASYRVATFRTAIKYGMIWVCLDDDSQEPLPTFEALEGYDISALGFGNVCLWPMSAARQIENFFDLAHLPLIHATTLGGDPNGKIKPARIEERDQSLLFTASFVETVPFEKPTECFLSYELLLPFGINFQSRPDGGQGFASVNIASPTTAHTCRVFQVIPVGKPGDIFDAPPVFGSPSDGPGVINQQDIDILSHLRIQDLPISEKLEIHLPVDNVSSAYRRRLRQLGLGRAEGAALPAG